MALESAPFINGLAPSSPSGSDRVHQGDDHIRLIKQALKNTFPNITGAVTLTQAQINALATAAFVPFGMITLWYGQAVDVPSGYAVCNGQTVAKSDGSGNVTTPDMRSRVAAGVGGALSVGELFGQATLTGRATDSGGGHTHAGSTASAGEHSHGGTTGTTSPSGAGVSASTSNFDPSSAGLAAVTAVNYTPPAGHNHSINPDGTHTHGLTIDAHGGHTHTIGDISVIQPSIALHYIMKV